ncbi:LTA synthase family protein [Enterococcus sp. 669A]|uniref:LTA synthase family protein n=1 Tax=Candidatus Enterococcus moelleringii TaxID=2815325 RepID=A0ABS3LHU0_9ENTE|nr:LTA synthase family protein [Enterococcus sp. 669A]MBO1308670.1 LTA synthase family protein [Enterococcus sp. 669A]
MKNRLKGFINTRIGLVVLLVCLLWFKSLFAYFVEFDLGIDNALQYFILFINPLASSLLILSISFYIRREKLAYVTAFVLYALQLVLLFANIMYYREFTDFLTVNTILGVGKVSGGLGESAMQLLHGRDLLYFIDLAIFPLLFWKKKLQVSTQKIRARRALSMSALALLLFSGNLFLAETSRTGLLTRNFSRNYLVKYLGVNVYTVLDGIQTYNTYQVRAEASPNELVEVQDYMADHFAQPNPEMFGLAEGKNVIYIHLESTQQFVIDYKLKDEAGVEHEVMPFVNSMYHDKSTFSFENFYHQVSAGKTSDAETLLETSLFGLSQGSLFSQLGDKNTFYAAPAILNQTKGYSSAAFHGNAGNFWNRNETYKRFGYQNFFDASYYDVNEDNSFQYGLHDKPFFQQSAPYLEHLQQPFYAKFIAVSNHYPYADLEGDNAGFPMATTEDKTINGYFATENYLDQSVEEFVNYLKDSGLYENSILVFYGDHYGISESRNKNLAGLLGEDSETWNGANQAEMQKVPLMFHIPGAENGGIQSTYGGQVDVLPTLLHLLGVNSQDYPLLGQDLFSAEHNQTVAFRNGDFVSPEYTSHRGSLYQTQTGELAEDASAADGLKEAVTTQLAMSDKINNGDLLRFYSNEQLAPVDPADFSYKNSLGRLEKAETELAGESRSVYSQHGGQTTAPLYETKTYQERQGIE